MTQPAPQGIPTNPDGTVNKAALLNEMLTVPGQLSNAYNRFYKYSFGNMVLMFVQTGKLEPAATFKKWNQLGRTITKGQHSLFVWAPRMVGVKDNAGKPVLDENGRKRQRMAGFMLRKGPFQLSQTEGPDLDMPELPDWSLTEAEHELGLTRVAFETEDGNTQGYSHGTSYAINPVAVAPLKTALHEIAHIVLGHTAEGFPYHGDHRGTAEFQAEAVAYLVSRELGIESFDESSSRAYIQTWLKGRANDYVSGESSVIQDATVQQIFTATDKLLTAGRKGHYAAMQHTATDKDKAA